MKFPKGGTCVGKQYPKDHRIATNVFRQVLHFSPNIIFPVLEIHSTYRKLASPLNKSARKLVWQPCFAVAVVPPDVIANGFANMMACPRVSRQTKLQLRDQPQRTAPVDFRCGRRGSFPPLCSCRGGGEPREKSGTQAISSSEWAAAAHTKSSRCVFATFRNVVQYTTIRF